MKLFVGWGFIQFRTVQVSTITLNKVWGNIHVLHFQSILPPQFNINSKISKCYGRMDMGYQSWYKICACLTLKTVLEEKQPNLTPIYLMHVQIYMYMYIYICLYMSYWLEYSNQCNNIYHLKEIDQNKNFFIENSRTTYSSKIILILQILHFFFFLKKKDIMNE